MRNPDLRYAVNSLLRNKIVNAALLVMLILSAFLMATGSMVMERLIGSVDQLFQQAKPPHFLQMHKGDYDRDALNRFAAQRPEIEAWLVEEMIGFESATIGWSRPGTGAAGDLSDSLIDNLFVTQNDEFDFLIDESGAIAQPGPGEVYVPVTYQQTYGLRAGDQLAIRTADGTRELRIVGFVRDAQMASSLSAATRFLISDADFADLARAGGGMPEIIVEYRLTDLAALTDFQRAYASDEALPKNGEAVTYAMVRLLHAISDGLVAVALVFVSLLLITIALLNLRFVIRGTLEDEVREIGAMKAIGLGSSAIARLYLAKYHVLTLLACAVGGSLAVLATNLLTRSLQVNYAEAPAGVATIVVPLIALALVYLFVIAICHRVLTRVKKIQVVGALIHGSTRSARETTRHAKRQAGRVRRTDLARYRGRNVNRWLTWTDLRAEAGQWVLIPIVFALATIVMTLPMNLLSTFENPRFFSSLGAGDSDLLVELPYTDRVDATRAELLAAMQSDDRLTEVRPYATMLYEIHGDAGWETIQVEVGDYGTGTVEYVDGARPEPGQIALSVLNAEKFQASIGDRLDLRLDGAPTTVEVSGIYQDITSGGDTAKMQGTVGTGAAGYVIVADTADGVDSAAVSADYNQRFATASALPMDEYAQQTLSYVTDAFRRAAMLSFAFGVGVASVITSLFLQLRLTRERRRMGVLSAIGFSVGEIIAQVRSKAALAMAAGILLGLLLTATAGESLVGLLFSLANIGIAELAFIPNPLLVYGAYPLILLAAGFLGAVILTARLRGADKSRWLAR